MQQANSQQPTANIKLNEEKLKAIPLKTKDKTRLLILSTSMQYSSKVLARTIKQLKETKGIQTRKEEVKVSLFIDMIVYIKRPKNFCQRTSTADKLLQKTGWIQK